MFFFFSKVLTIFLYPLPLAILITLLVFLFTHGFKKFLLGIVLFLLWFFSSFPVAQLLVRSLEANYPPISAKKAPRVDAIVVLGGMVNHMSVHKNRVEILGSGERLTDAILLYREGKADKILFTGGSGVLFYDKTSEAAGAKQFITNFGVPEENILIESRSRNTRENALYSAKILKRKGYQKILLITSAFHMRRAESLFRRQGIKVIPFPTDYRSMEFGWFWDVFVPSDHSLATSSIVIKEWVGIFVYHWMGYM